MRFSCAGQQKKKKKKKNKKKKKKRDEREGENEKGESETECDNSGECYTQPGLNCAESGDALLARAIQLLVERR